MTLKLYPAAQYLVDAAIQRSPEEFAWELYMFDGRYAAGIITDALENLRPQTPAANIRALRNRLAQLKKETT